MKILSTKILTNHQQDLLKGFDVKEVSMIDISFGEGFVLDQKIENAIFTSVNSVKSVFEVHKNKADLFNTVFCVGSKTQKLLEQHGVKVEVVASNAQELSDLLVDKIANHKLNIKEVNWFCGNIRNTVLPTIMAENGVLVTEYIVYQTTLVPQKIKEDFDIILFFSPTGIISYLKKNSVVNKPVVCIGVTTATEALNSFNEVYMAEDTTVESVIQKLKEII